MHLLHTADWHLGHRLDNRDRQQEHAIVLDAIVESLRERPVDLLLHAGDVFDQQMPGVAASRLYFETINTICREGLARQVVIVPGNHDSAGWLAAPDGLLRHRNVIIVGDATLPAEERVVLIRDGDGVPVAAVGGVGYLTMRDLRVNLTGDMDMEARSAAIITALRDEYARMADALDRYRREGLPVVVTGHLFAAGVSTTGSENDIHVGNLGRVGADIFADRFDYVALGHIHRPQMVAGNSAIRYSGSILPLDFGERNDSKSSLRVTLSTAGQPPRVEQLDHPAPRALVSLRGDADQLVAMMEGERGSGSDMLRPWLDLTLRSTGYDPEGENSLRRHAEQLGYQVLRLRVEMEEGAGVDEPEPGLTLRDITPADLFADLMEEENVPEEEREMLRLTFDELVAMVEENRE